MFPLTLWLVSKCTNYLKTIVPKALKRRKCAPNFELFQHQSIPNVIFPQICRISKALFTTVFTRFVAWVLIFFNLTHCRAPIQTGVYLSTGACYFQSKITTKIIVEDKYFTTFNLSPYESRNHGSRNQYYLLRNQCYLLCNWTSKALVLSAKT